MSLLRDSQEDLYLLLVSVQRLPDLASKDLPLLALYSTDQPSGNHSQELLVLHLHPLLPLVAQASFHRSTNIDRCLQISYSAIIS